MFRFPVTTLVDAETASPEETRSLAHRFGKSLKSGDVVLLSGELGAGKTCFTSGLVEAFGISTRVVSSPTFAIMNRYDGTLPVFHFDLYRLHSIREMQDAGLEEYLNAGGICLIEWPERAEGLIDPPFYIVELRHGENGLRQLRISKTG